MLKLLVDKGVFDVSAVVFRIGETLGYLFVEPVVGGIHQQAIPALATEAEQTLTGSRELVHTANESRSSVGTGGIVAGRRQVAEGGTPNVGGVTWRPAIGWFAEADDY